MEFLFNNIGKKSLKPGDHIYSYRKLHTYSHHGIYVGENMVIHFTTTEGGEASITGNPKGCKICGYNPTRQRGVVKSCVKCFLRHHRQHLYEYNVSKFHFIAKRAGTCSLRQSDDAGVVVRRATEMLNDNIGNFGEYNIRNNNCESFTVYCKTGQRLSAQYLAARQVLVNFIDNVTAGKSFNIQNVKDAAVEVVFGYKLDELEQYVKSVAQEERSKKKDTDYLSD